MGLMTRMKHVQHAGIVAALVAALSLAFATHARAQDVPTPFNIPCETLLDPELQTVLCTPIWKLKVGLPELAFGPPPNQTINFDSATGLLSIDANVHGIWLNLHGNQDVLDPLNPATNPGPDV